MVTDLLGSYLELAMNGPLDTETRENLHHSHAASKSLLFTINDLLVSISLFLGLLRKILMGIRISHGWRVATKRPLMNHLICIKRSRTLRSSTATRPVGAVLHSRLISRPLQNKLLGIAGRSGLSLPI